MAQTFPAASSQTGLGLNMASETRTVQDTTLFGYPNDCLVIQNNIPVYGKSQSSYPHHIIIYAGVPGALFNNAPKGSLFINCGGTPTLLVKTAEIGTGTWVATATLT